MHNDLPAFRQSHMVHHFQYHCGGEEREGYEKIQEERIQQSVYSYATPPHTRKFEVTGLRIMS